MCGLRLFKASSLLVISLIVAATHGRPALQYPLLQGVKGNRTITPQLFSELEELARIVDIAYCVGMSGIQKPFQCLGRCKDFPNFELVNSWNTGPLLSDSCGYIALDHSPSKPRIIVAFRGTYSIANTIADLSTIPQTYEPYVDDGENVDSGEDSSMTCASCTVHAGFHRSWRNTRDEIVPVVARLLKKHKEYTLHLVGHSLGGAVALLASLEMSTRGWDPIITTFGEPRVGNSAFVAHVDERFAPNGTYRRITHIDDPVPLLPLTEWGYLPHAGEFYISKAGLPPDVNDVQRCEGDHDIDCSATVDTTLQSLAQALDIRDAGNSDTFNEWLAAAAAYTSALLDERESAENEKQMMAAESRLKARGLIPVRYKLWQLFFAHRDYFWRLGVCLRGGDPWDWKGVYPKPPDNAFIEE